MCLRFAIQLDGNAPTDTIFISACIYLFIYSVLLIYLLVALTMSIQRSSTTNSLNLKPNRIHRKKLKNVDYRPLVVAKAGAAE